MIFNQKPTAGCVTKMHLKEWKAELSISYQPRLSSANEGLTLPQRALTV